MTRENTSGRREGKCFLFKWETGGFSLWFGRGGVCRQGEGWWGTERTRKTHIQGNGLGNKTKPNQQTERRTSRHALDITLSDKGWIRHNICPRMAIINTQKTETDYKGTHNGKHILKVCCSGKNLKNNLFCSVPLPFMLLSL